MKSVVSRIKPKNGYSHIFHIFLVALLPALIFVFVRINLITIAAVLILISKWRMFAVRPRYWPANIRANAVDLIVGYSILIFMANTYSASIQLIWALLYTIWLTYLKPKSTLFMVSLQAGVAQILGLMAIYLAFGDSSSLVLIALTWSVCYLSARHFLTSFDEPHISLLSHFWGYFAAALTWVLSHWLVYYWQLSQVTLILVVLGFGLSSLYYLEKEKRLTPLIRRQFVFLMAAVMIVLIVFSDWGDKTI